MDATPFIHEAFRLGFRDGFGSCLALIAALYFLRATWHGMKRKGRSP